MLDHALFCYEARKEVREHSKNKEKLWRFCLCKYKGSFSFSQTTESQSRSYLQERYDLVKIKPTETEAEYRLRL